MKPPALDLTRLDALLEYSRSIAFGDWVASASGPDLHQAHHALENFAVLCADRLFRWRRPGHHWFRRLVELSPRASKGATEMSAFLGTLVIAGAVSLVLMLAGVLADWAWPLLENRARRTKRQATYIRRNQS